MTRARSWRLSWRKGTSAGLLSVGYVYSSHGVLQHFQTFHSHSQLLHTAHIICKLRAISQTRLTYTHARIWTWTESCTEFTWIFIFIFVYWNCCNLADILSVCFVLPFNLFLFLALFHSFGYLLRVFRSRPLSCLLRSLITPVQYQCKVVQHCCCILQWETESETKR